MVIDRKQHSGKTPVKQGRRKVTPQPNKIGASTPYDFSGKNLTESGKPLVRPVRLEKV